jgi:hypothetical protein
MFHDFCSPAAVKPVAALRLLTPQRQTFSQPVESDLNRNSHNKSNENKPGQIPRNCQTFAAASPEPWITGPILRQKNVCLNDQIRAHL